MSLPRSYFEYPRRRPGMDHDRFGYTSLFRRKPVQWPTLLGFRCPYKSARYDGAQDSMGSIGNGSRPGFRLGAFFRIQNTLVLTLLSNSGGRCGNPSGTRGVGRRATRSGRSLWTWMSRTLGDRRVGRALAIRVGGISTSAKAGHLRGSCHRMHHFYRTNQGQERDGDVVEKATQGNPPREG